MRFSEFKLLPMFEMAAAAVDDLKQQLAGKIQELPADDVTIKTLREIEDLLRDVNAGGRTGLLNKDLQSIQDPIVRESHMLLARYINQIISFGNATPEDRTQLFDLWRADELVDREALLGGDLVGFTEIFRGYSKNPIIQELVDELMVISALGHGKGEFGLSVLSKSINKPESGKGDLLVRHDGKEHKVEVKTADMGKDKFVIDKKTGKKKFQKGKMSSARFGDQEVVPATGYEAASAELNDFVNKKLPRGEKKLGQSGLNVPKAIELLQTLNPADSNKLLGMIRRNVKLIFGKKFENARPDYQAKLTKNINGILSSIEKGDASAALQYWSRANFNYYMAAKHDDGVLFINIPQRTAIYYSSAEDLGGKGLRLNADTTYISGGDPKRTVYPQIQVTPTSYGASTASQELSKLGKKPPKRAAGIEEFKQQMLGWAGRFANLRNVRDKRVIQKMAIIAGEMRLNGADTNAIIAELESQIPQLQVQYAREIPKADRLYTPYVPPTSDEEDLT